MTGVSIIVPAHNEAALLGRCLDNLLSQNKIERRLEIIVVANGCTDSTFAIAQSYSRRFQEHGLGYSPVDLAEGGKTNAINQGEAIARYQDRIYIDADVVLSPNAINAVVDAIDREAPVHACCRLVMDKGQSWSTELYRRLWYQLPFARDGFTGGGLYAVNHLGRQRWGQFPAIIADDIFVRSQFSPDERVHVDEECRTNLAEGFLTLIRVRRRQNSGMRQLAQMFPDLIKNDPKERLGPGEHIALFLKMPLAYLTYASIILASRLAGQTAMWARDR
ncbi:MAG: glycosyltransferase family 2 protein [Pseudomonadota bacterium]